MDVLADFLKTAGVLARVDTSPYSSQAWPPSATPPSRQPVGSTGRALLRMLCVATGAYSLVENQSRTQLVEGDVVFLHEANDFRAHGLKPESTLITGSIIFRAGAMALTTLNLPSATIVHGQDNPECKDLIRRLANEVMQAPAGWEHVAECLAISVFITSLRASGSCQTKERNGQGWLRALVDPEISNAFKLMHRSPEHRWTVAELADELAVSRSAFAERFKKVTGRPPLEYLTWWRLQRAIARLRSGEIATLYEAARSAGYQSEAAFSKAFRREFGMPPGEVRRKALAQKETPSQLQLEIKKRLPFESPEQEVGLNLVRTFEGIRQPFEELLDSHELTGPDYNILRILRGKNCPMAIDEVRGHLLIPYSNLSQRFEYLAKKQYISLDEESALWCITDEGRMLLSKLDEPTMYLHRRQFSHFSSAELAEFNRLLVKLRSPAS